ncbi:hypothetical protein V491_00489 [Pseudogymnoascus sp. VKM F-3775]|nr:hypothetical protein V491_00489 [Pseudogymnoascus sp. VKM F-3775]
MAEGLGLAASIIAVIELSAKVASLCLEYYTNVKNARDDITRLQREADRLEVTLKQVQSLVNGPNSAKLEASRTLRNGVNDCSSQLADLETKLEPGKRHKVMRRFGYRALKWPFKNEEVEGILKNLGRCKEMIFFGLQVDQTTLVLDVHQEIVLSKLHTAEGAAFDSYAESHEPRCHQDTRVDLLHQVDIWACDPDSECVFWLNGMAGTGKSTISRTVAHSFADKGEIVASFFYKRGEGDRGHAALFFTTITAQLVRKLPSLAPHVRDAIEADPAISGKSLKDQFEKLVLQPFDNIQSYPPKLSRIVVVVDALDECDQEEDVRIIIQLLSQVKHWKSVRLKFFVTSRPELPIRLGLEDIRGKYKGLLLHNVPNPIIDHDISAFLEYELARIRDDFNKSATQDRRLPLDWPGQTNLHSLVRMAIPLFIFAATVCRFIKDRKCGEPDEQLAKILKYQTKSQESKLDATYLPVLDQLHVDLTANERRQVVESFQEVVGSIVILASPLSTISLARLLGIPKRAVDTRIDLLHSVLSIPSNPNIPVRLLHLSFRDFLLDTEKRETNPFWVDEKNAHAKFAAQCLQRLSAGDGLKKDICNLRMPGRLRTEVDKQTINACLPLDVQYACQCWVYHLKKGRDIICDNDQVYNFLMCHFLHWLEALSLIGRLSESIVMIDSLLLIADHTTGTKLSGLLYDAKRFVLNYYSIADLSPLQLYSSALIFAPKASIIRNTFQNCIPSWVSQQPEVELGWNAVQQTLEGHSNLVNSVAFSHGSKLLASASSDKTVKIWDASTGSLQQTLEGHSRRVRSVAFSHDSKLLASASHDATAKIWDVSTGSLQQTLEGHSSSVISVAFSHNSNLLASASSDKTVKIWDASSGSLQQTLEGHSHSVISVAFSHDSTLLASASMDATIKIWDMSTGSLQQTLEGHSGSVGSVAFSHDSTLLASRDATIKIWDMSNGSLQQTLEGHSKLVYSVAFSHDSKLLASASDYAVKIWDMSTGSLQPMLDGHSVTRQSRPGTPAPALSNRRLRAIAIRSTP